MKTLSCFRRRSAAFSKVWKKRCFLFPRLGKLGAFLLIGTLAARAANKSDWPIADAPIRFAVRVTAGPSIAEAGIVAIIPDGGLLPRPAPDPVVLDANGATLKSEVLWFSAHDGIAVVFEPPHSGAATIYFRPAASFTHLGNRPNSLFKSSLVLMVKMGNASMNSAMQIPAEAWQGGVRMTLASHIGHCENLLGPTEDYNSYYAGWIKAPRAAAKAYFCTISSDGSEARLDGKVVARWPGIHSRKDGAGGKFGSWLELSAGLHRVEYYHFKKGHDAAEVNLCWRLPGDKVPQTLTVKDYVQSGQAKVYQIETADGTPPAAIAWSCESYLWLRTWPWNLFTLRVMPAANAPTNAVYTWEPAPGVHITGREFNWIFAGPNERSVGLTVKLGQTSAQSVRTVYFSQTPARATINSPTDRMEYRKALLARCQAVPPPARPCAAWDEELWSLLTGVTEPLAGLNLMQDVFERSWNDILRRPVLERYRLEDIYFDLIRYTNKGVAEGWLTKFETADSTNRERQVHWQLMRVDFVLNDLGRTDAARKLVDTLQAHATSSNEIARAMIRRGDIERFAGDADAAAKFYSAAQDSLGKKPAKVAKAPVAPPPSKAEKDSERSGKGRERKNREARIFSIAPSVDDWRKQAVREAAYYETLHSQLLAHAIEDARQTLDAWELEFPLSKLAGDYPIGEGEFFTTIGDFPRALRVLSAYRKNVELSNYLPQAMGLECRCLLALKRTDEFKTLAQELVARFPGHPAGKDIQVELDMLASRSKGGRVMRLEDFK